MEDKSIESCVNSVYTAKDSIPSPRLSSRHTPKTAHDVTDCCDISVGLPLSSDYLGATSDEEFKYEDCISDDEPSSVPIIDYGSASVVLHSMRSHSFSGRLDYWESRLVIDSGATTSIVCQREWISRYTPERSKVKGLDSTLLLDGKGSGDMLVTLEDGLKLKINDVLYVPDAKFNLISVNSIVKDTGYEVLFKRHECLLANTSNPSDYHVLGYCDDGLYYIACECVTGYKHGVRTFVCIHEPPYTALAASELIKPTTPFVSPTEFTNVTETSIPTLAGEYSLFDAHCVLGHPSFKVLRKMVHLNLLKPVNLHDASDRERILNCPECAVTKLVRSPHNSPSSTNKATHPLERLHIDLSGPHEIRDNRMYLMAIKDEFTGYIHAEFLKSKSSTDTLNALRRYVNYMKSRVPQHTIGSIRTDNGAEFRNHLWDEFFLQEGITRDIIAAYTPETNGFAESSNRQLLLRANCLLLPTNTASESTLFDFATLYAAYLINRTVNIRKGHTPFELLFHKKPNLGNLIRFGSDVLVKPPQQSVSKVSNKMNVICGTFLGNSTDSNCYKVWIRGDMKFRIYLTTNVKPLKTFRYLWQNLKSLSAHPMDPRADAAGISNASEAIFRPPMTVIGSGQLPKVNPNTLKANDIAVHNSADSSVEPSEVSASANEVNVKAGAQHVGCSDEKLGNPEPTPMRMKQARRSAKSQTAKDVLENSTSSVSSTADVESKSIQMTSRIDSKVDAHIHTGDANIPTETDHLRKEPITVKPTNLVKTDSVTSSAANSTLSYSQVGPTPLEPPPIDHGELTAARAARAARSGMGKRLHVTTDMKTKIASHNSELKNVKATKRAARRKSIPPVERLVTVPDETEDIPMLNRDGPILISSEDPEYQDMLEAIDFDMIHDTTPTFFSRFLHRRRCELGCSLRRWMGNLERDRVTRADVWH